MKLPYRADIDGLRAIAVLAVIFYHADIEIFSGGFVGVDIFFVISGYLITTIISREVDENDFSLLKFYERRIRRIFPALFTVLLVTLLAAALLFSAQEFQEFGNSLIATTLFASNLLFWSESGYFDAPSALKPLLHTWSLAVEEQYYIFFPLLFVFLARYLRPTLKFVLVVMALASFALNVYTLNYDASRAFYLPHMRIWELLIGSLLAVRVVPIKTNFRIRNLLAMAGLAMLIGPVFLYTNDTPFPGIAAAIPALGSALIIYSGINENQTFVGRILGFWPIVFIGQISYSLYLWHWPVIVFTKYYAILELKIWEMAAVLLIIFILSILSWHFIEKPFRQRTFLEKRKIFGYAAIAMFSTLALGSVIYTNNGFPTRFSIHEVDRDADAQVIAWRKCGVKIKKQSSLKFCNLGKSPSGPVFLLFGDSHTRAMATSIKVSASHAGVAGLVAYMPGCPPLLGVYPLDHESDTCDVFLEGVMNYIQDHPNLKTIILASRWALYSKGTRYKTESGNTVLLASITGSTPTDTNTTLFKVGLARTVNKLLEMGRAVVIVGQVPEIGYDVPSAFSIAQRTGRDINQIIAPSLNEYIDRNIFVTTVIKSLAENDNVQVVEPWKILCNKKNCLVAITGKALYRDDDHLSLFGAHYISDIFDPVFKNLSLAGSTR